MRSCNANIIPTSGVLLQYAISFAILPILLFVWAHRIRQISNALYLNPNQKGCAFPLLRAKAFNSIIE